MTPAQLTRHPGFARHLRARYNALCVRRARNRFVDKAPTYTAMLPTLRELWHDAYVVHIVRDGRAVVNSIAYGFKSGRRRGQWWGPVPPGAEGLAASSHVERACHQWRALVEEGRSAIELFPGRYHELRYEDLVSRTRATMERLFAAIALPPLAADRFPERMANRNYKWQAASGASFGDSIWTDGRAIDDDEVDLLESLRPLLESLGYLGVGEPLLPRSHPS